MALETLIRRPSAWLPVLHSVFAVPGLCLLLYRLMKLDISWDFSLSQARRSRAKKLFGVIFLLILFYNIWQVAKARPVEMLAGKQTGEREPRRRGCLRFASWFHWRRGTGLPVSTERTAMMIIAFFMVLFVVAGTGLLFTAGSVTLLKLLKKNKGYYYQTRHFISVSGMIYRMKQNAARSVCDLPSVTAAVLVMLSCTVSPLCGTGRCDEETVLSGITW